MQPHRLNQQIEAFAIWKQEVIHHLNHFRKWLRENQLDSEDISERLNSAQNALQSDRITLALVGEFSRGKTELINALFFARYGQRLLPSRPGRTTMCPTELFFDLHNRASYLKLLPIENRCQTATLKQLKAEPHLWLEIPLDLSNPEEMSQVLSEVAHCKSVSREEAATLRFEVDTLQPDPNNPNLVMIPAWQHALVSFEHPLLRQGLTIIDTPGLNALGSEPELTLSFLAEAHAVLFVLSADVGVSNSDLKIWERHISALCGRITSGVYAVMNKIDLLWDDPDGEDQSEANIQFITAATSKQLGIPNTGLLPVSAKQGLLAKLTGESELLNRSHLPELEHLLSNSIIAGKETAIQKSIIKTATQLLIASCEKLKHQQELLLNQKNSLEKAQSADQQKLINLSKSIKTDYEQQQKDLLIVETSQRILKQKSSQLLEPVKPHQLELYIQNLQQAVASCWTTKGMRRALDQFFKHLTNDVKALAANLHRVQLSIEELYQRLAKDNPITIDYLQFDTSDALNTILSLEKKTQKMHRSFFFLLTRRQTILTKFVNTVTLESQTLYETIYQQAKDWCNHVLTPLVEYTKNQNESLSTQLNQLGKLSNQEPQAITEISRLNQMYDNIGKQLNIGEEILTKLTQLAPQIKDKKTKPASVRPVRSRKNHSKATTQN